jgi:hypothetical protein
LASLFFVACHWLAKLISSSPSSPKRTSAMPNPFDQSDYEDQQREKLAMKITIEPSTSADSRYHPTVSIDTRSNDDLTPDVVRIAMDAIIACGHHPMNVSDAAQQVSIEIQQANNNNGKE